MNPLAEFYHCLIHAIPGHHSEVMKFFHDIFEKSQAMWRRNVYSILTAFSLTFESFANEASFGRDVAKGLSDIPQIFKKHAPSPIRFINRLLCGNFGRKKRILINDT